MAAPTFTVDQARHGLTITADLRTDEQTAWALWADPRTLEQWWGPPDHPCIVTHFDLRPGGLVTYVMTGPDGTRYPGWWEVMSVDAPHGLTIRDGFGESPQESSAQMPVTHTVITFMPIPDAIRMTITSTYESTQALQFALDLGMEEGFMAALGQIAFLDKE
jgi:uncharacterized protein YndB with AHSA1/START domain